MHSKAVYLSLGAIIFLGTPHRGGSGSYVELASAARKIAVLSGFSARANVLKDLKFDSTIARVLQEDFVQLLDEKRPSVLTFREGKGLTAFAPFSGKVVEDVSSSLDYASGKIDFIDANHMNMCRFTGPNDPGYVKIKDALLLWFKQSQSANAQGIDKASEEAGCLRSLAFAEMDERHHNIEVATAETCEWLLQHDTYKNWISQGQGFLWLMVNPGAGKSMLLKFVCRQCVAQGTDESKVIASFFFHDRGSEIQKSSFGLFRSLLHQILLKVPSLLSDLTSIYRQKNMSIGKHRDDWEWYEAALRDFMASAVSKVQSLCSTTIFIDALDEGGEDTARNLIDYFSSIGASKLHICFSCRYYPAVKIRHGSIIRVERENSKGLELFARERLANIELPAEKGQTLTEALLKKASGSFQWTRLVLQDLVKMFAEGRSIQELFE